MTNSRATTGAKPTLTVMRVATLMLASALLVACSREKIDWKSAEAADTVEAYDHFLERHPDGELSTQARARVAQLNEERDWKKAAAADTADAYRQFLAQHENGKWAAEARIRVENFALDGTATGPMRPVMETEGSSAGGAAVAQPAAYGARGDAQPVAVAAAAGGAERPSAMAAPAAATGTVATPAAATSAASAPNHVAAGSGPANPGATTPASASAKSPPSAPSASASVANSSAPNHSPTTPAASKPGATTAAPAASSSQFGIQLGAFRSQQAALTDWKRIQARFDSDLHGLFAKAVPVQQAGGQLFRLQAPVGEESRARAICASLAKQSQPCVVVLPQSH